MKQFDDEIPVAIEYPDLVDVLWVDMSSNRVFRKLCDKHPNLKGERYSQNGRCVGCHREKMIARRKAKRTSDPENFLRVAHEKQAERVARPGYREARKIFRRRPEVKERKAAYMAAYRRLPERLSAHASRERLRRAQLKVAMPVWADAKKILAVYTKAREKGLTVDHIVPLLGRNVCGLHVHYNLRTVTRSVNAAKGNRHEGDLSES